MTTHVGDDRTHAPASLTGAAARLTATPSHTPPAGQAPAGSTIPVSRRSPHQAKRVLVVEDEALIALDLERRLVRLGYQVVGRADNKVDAVAQFTTQRPDLVLMDIFIRGPADGIETAKAITEIDDVPVIFLTAFADEDTVQRAAAISPYGYLLKPFDERTLSATITVALERHAADTRTRLLGAAVESATIGIALVDVQGAAREIVYVNDAFLQLAGATREMVIGQPPCFLADDPEQESVVTLRDALDRRTAADAVVSGRRRDDAAFWSSVSLSPVTNRSGQVTHLILFHKDVTRERAAEASLADSQRMELMGRITAGIAHDFNNVLGAISGFADLAREGLEDPIRRADMDEVIHSARRGAMLTRKLLDFSRRSDSGQTGSADLTRVITEARAMCERLAGTKVRLELHLAPDPMFVRADATGIEQILMNLVANASDAMPRGGRITVRASRPDAASGAMEPMRYARLEVSDTGSGMDEKTMARIFEPLFTTKPRGAGTGLGLSTCKMLAERAGGDIRVHSKIGEGSTFVLDLPIADRPSEMPDFDRHTEITTSADGAWCLLVEDEPTLRRACARALVQVGFQVVEAPNGEQALREIDTLGTQLRLIVCDMVLPGIGGVEVLSRAHEMAPHAARLVITGYFDAGNEPLAPGIEVLWKPFGTGTLARRALDALHALPSVPPDIGPTEPTVQTPTPKALAPAVQPSTAPDLRRATILLVDPDADLRRALHGLLHARGLIVVEAANAEEAIALVASSEPCVAVVDVQAGDPDGPKLLQRIRQQDALLPLLVMTDQPTVETAQEALRARATGYLTKPFDDGKFTDEVDRAVAEGQVARLQHQLLATRGSHGTSAADLAETGRQFDEALQQVRVVFQPIVRAYDRSVFAFEALLRCDHPKMNGPAPLLQAAEALGRQRLLGRVVRTKIAETLAKHPDRHEPVFVNLHAMEVRTDILAAEDEPLLPYAQRIVLEVTERAQLEESRSLEANLTALRGVGYRIALDDLGEGYAGLSWLVRLTPDVAKIDMSLVRDIHQSRLKRELVASLVGVCRRARCIVVAEGVENADEGGVLVDLGCDLLQGYHFARPGPAFPTVTPDARRV